jgi:hypothetical protein
MVFPVLLLFFPLHGPLHVEGHVIGIVATTNQDLSDKQPMRDVPGHKKFTDKIRH